MKCLVTGINGQLGHDVVKELEHKGYKDIYGVDKNDLDITNHDEVISYVNNIQPDVIFHNAAYTQVDNAEDEKEICYNVNVIGTKNLVEAARNVDAKIIYISTDYVFSGTGTTPYEVDDEKNPQNYYGKTKYEGELEVEKYPKHFIVRTSWVFGINGKNFVKTMLRVSKDKQEVSVVSDQIGSPTYTVDLANLLVTMAETEKYGTYHANNEGYCSWAEFTEYIYKTNNINTKVKHISTSEYKTKAVRPLNSRLSKKSLINNGFKLLPTWQDAIDRYNIELSKEGE